MRTKTFLLTLFFSTFLFSVYGQKGIFKKGKIQQEKYSVTLDVEANENIILVDVKIGAKTYKFFLDTGAPTVFGTSIIGDFKELTTKEITDASNTTETVKYITVPKIEIGNLTYQNISAMQYDIAVLEQLGADGILGANIMAKSVWDFNMESNQIIVSNTIDEQIAKKIKPVKIKLLETGSPLFKIKHFDAVKEKIYVDFGFNGLFSLANTTYQKLKEKNVVKRSISGKGRYMETAFSEIDSVFRQVILKSKISHLQLPDFIADVDYDEESSIGSEWLNYYRIIIDFPKKKMYFLPYDKKLDTQFKSYGIDIEIENDEMLVSFIWMTSKAYKGGIRASDKILSINGINTKNIDQLTQEDADQINELFEGNDKIILEINKKGNFIEIEKELLLK